MNPLLNEESQEIIALLKENNLYLKNLWELKKKEHRSAVISHVFHLILAILPWVVVLILGYFIWQTIMHYLDALNQNVNVLKSNFDAIYGFLKKLIPDFSKIDSQLQQVWQKIQFWK